jgi:hypothetical protein
MSRGQMSKGLNVHGASCPWGRILWVCGHEASCHGASCHGGEMSMRQVVMGRVVLAPKGLILTRSTCSWDLFSPGHSRHLLG